MEFHIGQHIIYKNRNGEEIAGTIMEFLPKNKVYIIEPEHPHLPLMEVSPINLKEDKERYKQWIKEHVSEQNIKNVCKIFNGEIIKEDL